jgi:hypothetical protein
MPHGDLMRAEVFTVMTPCSLVGGCQHFGGSSCPYLLLSCLMTLPVAGLHSAEWKDE